jgi:hypothetical protein
MVKVGAYCKVHQSISPMKIALETLKDVSMRDITESISVELEESGIILVLRTRGNYW